jgi:hypothetical protein
MDPWWNMGKTILVFEWSEFNYVEVSRIKAALHFLFVDNFSPVNMAEVARGCEGGGKRRTGGTQQDSGYVNCFCQPRPPFALRRRYSDKKQKLEWWNSRVYLHLASWNGINWYPKQSATFSVGSVLKWHSSSRRHDVNLAEDVVIYRALLDPGGALKA